MFRNIAAFGMYSTRDNVETAVDMLKNANYRNSDISVLFSQEGGSNEFATEKHTKAPEGAVAGAGTGAVIGGTLGWLAGIGVLSIPGAGPFIAAGPIMAALAGVGVGGAVGGISGTLIGLGISEFEAKRFAERITKGEFLLSIHCDDAVWTKKAMEIMASTGGKDVTSNIEATADLESNNTPVERLKPVSTVSRKSVR